MPSSPARAPRPPPKPAAPRRTQSHMPRSTPAPPPAVRRHTTYTPSSPRRIAPPGKSPSLRRRTTSPPARGGQHVLIPVPVRAKDSESPVYVRAPPGQRVDFVFSPPKKRGIIGRLLDSVEWGGPEENKPFRYRKPNPKHPGGSRPFYKKLMS